MHIYTKTSLASALASALSSATPQMLVHATLIPAKSTVATLGTYVGPSPRRARMMEAHSTAEVVRMRGAAWTRRSSSPLPLSQTDLQNPNLRLWIPNSTLLLLILISVNREICTGSPGQINICWNSAHDTLTNVSSSVLNKTYSSLRRFSVR